MNNVPSYWTKAEHRWKPTLKDCNYSPVVIFPPTRAHPSADSSSPLGAKSDTLPRKALAVLAPELPDWAVYGLLPPISQKVEVRFQLPIGVLYPGDVWVHLLENPNDPSFLGLHLALKLYDHCPDEDAIQQLQSMLIQLVAYVLGEESWAMNIQHLQLGPLPPDPMEEGMIVLYDLPEAVADFRKEQPGPNWEKQVMGEDE